MTLYDGMKNANLLHLPDMSRPECVVHVISANSLERKYVPAWELLLHRLTCIKQLTIVLIGPELEDESEDIKVCQICIRRKQKLRFECCPMFYHRYTSSASFQQPNVIIIFQAHFDSMWTWWRSSLLESQRMNCPCLLTAGSQSIAEQNVNDIQKLIDVNPVYSAPNNFRSLVPFRQLHVDYIGYRNSYVNVYQNLYSLQEPSQTI